MKIAGSIDQTVDRRGVITLAIGDLEHIELAVTMGRSLKFHNPSLKRAIVTDRDDSRLKGIFDYVIKSDGNWGGPFRQKLSLNQYSPFEETIYIDSDCLVVGDLEPLWAMYDTNPVTVIGNLVTEGHWYADVAALIRLLRVDAIPKFNSGLFYFRRCSLADDVFSRAREFIDNFRQFGIGATHNDQCGDEPALALALAIHGIGPVDDNAAGQWGVFHYEPCRLEINVLSGSCRYIYTDGRVITPKVAHFLASGWRQPIYQRESLKLKLAEYRLPHRLVSIIADSWIACGQWLRQTIRPYLRREKSNPCPAGNVV